MYYADEEFRGYRKVIEDELKEQPADAPDDGQLIAAHPVLERCLVIKIGTVRCLMTRECWWPSLVQSSVQRTVLCFGNCLRVWRQMASASRCGARQSL
jgi:hypothetical protein